MSALTSAAAAEDRALFAADFLVLYAALDAELPEGEKTKVLAVGGAAIIGQWDHRGSGDVDIVSKSLTPVVQDAVARVGRQYGLRPDWLNDAAKVSAPNLPANPTCLYAGDRFEVYIPDNEYLLVSKLFAARAVDAEDAYLLAQATGKVTAEDLMDSLQRGYPKRLLTPKHQYFAESIAAKLAKAPPNPPSPDLAEPADPGVH